MAREKKPFKWDAEKKIGEFGGEKERHHVYACELNGTRYVSDVKEVLKKGEWTVVKNITMKRADFDSLVEIVTGADFDAAFDDPDFADGSSDSAF